MGVSKGAVTGSINRCKSHDSVRSMASFLYETRPFRKCKAGGRGQHTAKLVAGEVTLQMCLHDRHDHDGAFPDCSN